MRARHTGPAEASSPAAMRGRRDAPARTDWLVHLLAWLAFLLHRGLSSRRRHAAGLAWLHARPDLPPASTQALAAAIRGAFGNAIAWMCLRNGIGPDHPDWPYLSRTIQAFGGSLDGFYPGAPACGLQWWENPDIMPGMVGMLPEPTMLDALLSRQARDQSATSRRIGPRLATPAARPLCAPGQTLRRRGRTDPATGPPHAGRGAPPAIPLPSLNERGRSAASPAVAIRATPISPTSPRRPRPTTSAARMPPPPTGHNVSPSERPSQSNTPETRIRRQTGPGQPPPMLGVDAADRRPQANRRQSRDGRQSKGFFSRRTCEGPGDHGGMAPATAPSGTGCSQK